MSELFRYMRAMCKNVDRKHALTPKNITKEDVAQMVWHCDAQNAKWRFVEVLGEQLFGAAYPTKRAQNN